jgi:predicted ATPase
MPVWKAAGTFCEGWLRWGKLGCEADLVEMHEGMALMRLQQQGVFMPMFMTRLAETEAEAGHPEAALDTLDMQLETIKRTGQRWYLSEVHRARGETMLKCWPIDSVAAEGAFLHAIEIARGQSAKLFELQAAVSLARLWRDQGKRAEARDLLGPIYDWFIEGLDAPDLKDANALLNELT